MSQPTEVDVLILGAGAAGLAAAVALSGAGARVSLLERKPFVGLALAGPDPYRAIRERAIIEARRGRL